MADDDNTTNLPPLEHSGEPPVSAAAEPTGAAVASEATPPAADDPAVVGAIAPVVPEKSAADAAAPASPPMLDLSAKTAIPFTVAQTNQHDSLPVGSTVTVVSPGVVEVDNTVASPAQHTIQSGDPVVHLPIGATLSVISGPAIAGHAGEKAIAVTIPETDVRKSITVIGTHVHDAIARAWRWIEDECADAETLLKKAL